ncbi:MAG: DMT family transporter [Verrucomicrobiota bacterium]
MISAFVATLLFALSSVAAKRSVELVGSSHANLIRMALATVFLALMSHTLGFGLGGPSLGWFIASGLIGFGLCDTAIFLALPRLGAQLTSLMVQCIAAPMAAIFEWSWLGTPLTREQIVAGMVILGGVGVALMPGRGAGTRMKADWIGLGLGFIAAAGQAGGAVLSRHGQLLSRLSGMHLDGISVAYQRILSGLLFTLLWWFWSQRSRIGAPPPGGIRWRAATPWILLNALSGPSLGVASYQWALQVQPTGIVVAITALTPLVVIPLAFWIDGERPTRRSLLGGLLGVGGAIWLVLQRAP